MTPMATPQGTDGSQQAPTIAGSAAVHRIDVEPAGRNRWHYLLASELLATGKSVFGVCRILAERGFTGSIETWHRGEPYPSMRIKIASGALLICSETDALGLRFVPWRPFERPSSPDMRLPVNRSSVQADCGVGGMAP